MTGHFCIRELEALSPLPLINVIPEIDAELRRRNLKTVGILGTRCGFPVIDCADVHIDAIYARSRA
jgi:aspartate/glutamate racemase